MGSIPGGGSPEKTHERKRKWQGGEGGNTALMSCHGPIVFRTFTLMACHTTHRPSRGVSKELVMEVDVRAIGSPQVDGSVAQWTTWRFRFETIALSLSRRVDQLLTTANSRAIMINETMSEKGSSQLSSQHLLSGTCIDSGESGCALAGFGLWSHCHHWTESPFLELLQNWEMQVGQCEFPTDDRVSDPVHLVFSSSMSHQNCGVQLRCSWDLWERRI